MRVTSYLGRLSGLLWILIAALLVLFGASALLVVRTAQRLSSADLEQQRESLQASVRSFRIELTGTLFDLASGFRPPFRVGNREELESDLRRFYRYQSSQSPHADLLESLSLGWLAGGEPRFRRLEGADEESQSVAWPAELLRFQEPRNLNLRSVGLSAAGGLLQFNGLQPIVAIPILAQPPVPAPEARRRGFPGMRQPPPGALPPDFPFPGDPRNRARLLGWCFLGLNLDVLRSEILPSLVERHFGRLDRGRYRIAVIDTAQGEIVFSSRPGLTPEELLPADEQLPLFPVRASQGLYAINPGGLRGALRGRPPEPPERLGPEEREPDRLPARPVGWVLAVRHELGSLESAVIRDRNRNLALGFGILFLLAGGIAILGLNVRNARILARRQMEFVAGISHELHTPLAVIQSAAFNLSRGLISETGRIQEYGQTIDRESRRLRQMIGQILTYARLEHRRTPVLEAVDLRAMLDRTLQEYEPAFAESGWTVERRLDPVPPVLAEKSSLESVVRNLLDNALRYAAEGLWLGVQLRSGEDDPGQVELSVEDHGPGIDASDLPHIFEPFYRGHRHTASNIPGSGLGLSLVRRLVESMGGRIKVESVPGRTVFRLRLPSAGTVQTQGAPA